MEWATTEADDQLTISPLRTENFFTSSKRSPSVIFVYSLLAITLAGNALVLTAYTRFPSIRCPSTLLVVHQSVSDVLFALSAQVYIFIQNADVGVLLVSRHHTACLLLLTFAIQMSLCYAINLLALSTERLVAVAFPFHAVRLFTEPNIRKVIGLLWLLHLVIFSLPVLGWNTWRPGNRCLISVVYPQEYRLYFIVLPHFVLLILMALVNLVVSGVAVRARRKIRPNVPADKNAEQPPKKADFKVTKMFLMIVGVYYLSYFPRILLSMMEFFPPPSLKGGAYSWLLILGFYVRSLNLIGPAVNPMIYAWRSEKFNYAFKKLLHLD